MTLEYLCHLSAIETEGAYRVRYYLLGSGTLYSFKGPGVVPEPNGVMSLEDIEHWKAGLLSQGFERVCESKVSAPPFGPHNLVQVYSPDADQQFITKLQHDAAEFAKRQAETAS
jgi:hypothetical protein